MSDLRKDIIGVIIASAIVFMSAIISIAVYHINDRALMSKNIDAAIAKGVDPVAVRCSFVQQTDTICVAYAAAQGSHTGSPSPKK
jgi:hypothetical protein|tara:strand:+ start:387 stop:641 length:255 start_codon:yes stop_codon:yes gene_type:complete